MSNRLSETRKRLIRTPDQRLRVFVSSTLQELARERTAAQEAILQLRLAPVMFELGARPHPPRDLYQSYLDQSHIFVGIYWQRYGWVAPGMDVSGIEDEYQLSGDLPRLIYVKTPESGREPRLIQLLDRITADNTASFKPFASPDELRTLIENDLALLLAERFEASRHELPPPSPTVPSRRGNLPRSLTPLIDREAEKAAALQLLSKDEVGLVTLTGPGGVGKTRLGLEVASDLADRFEDGAYLITLASIRDSILLAPAIGTALGVGPATGDPMGNVRDHLKHRHVLLVLDDFERLVSAGSLVADLLSCCPRLKVLATSRIPLHLRGERVLSVEPLGLPDPRANIRPEQVSLYPSMELFVERVRDVRPGFLVKDENAAAALAEICRRLDGLPLAIELAAARCKILSPEALLARLDNLLAVLTGGPRDLSPHQLALRSTIAWSHDLLDRRLQTLLRRLSVFAGGWDLEAAEAICNANRDLDTDLLEPMAALVDNSLVVDVPEFRTGPRFRMLGMIRDFAKEQLSSSSEEAAIRTLHAAYFLGLAEHAHRALLGRDQASWLERLESEIGNIRTALEWYVDHKQWDQCLQLASWLWRFWEARGHWNEGRRWLMIARDGEKEASPEVRGYALIRAGWFTQLEGDYEEAREMIEQGLELQRQLGNQAGVALGLSNLAWVLINQGRPTEARSMLEQSLALRRGLGRAESDGVVATLLNLGLLELAQNDLERAAERFASALELARSQENDDHLMKALTNLGNVRLHMGKISQALALYEEASVLAKKLGDRANLAVSTGNLAMIALNRKDYPEARTLLGKAVRLFSELGDRHSCIVCLQNMAFIAAMEGKPESAARVWGFCEAMRERLGVPMTPHRRVLYEEELKAARARCDEAAFMAALAAGRSLTIDQAIGVATGEVTGKSMDTVA